MIPSVGFAKSCCSTVSAFFGASSIAGVVGSVGASLGDGWLCGSAFPDSDIGDAVCLSHEVWVERWCRCGRNMVTPRM